MASFGTPERGWITGLLLVALLFSSANANLLPLPASANSNLSSWLRPLLTQYKDTIVLDAPLDGCIVRHGLQAVNAGRLAFLLSNLVRQLWCKAALPLYILAGPTV